MESQRKAKNVIMKLKKESDQWFEDEEDL
ncbi:uncharacterized protein G2W53_003500 [Senna tora]|uniref:Uncharacterized protein n=1 Tax=Senna tora TaxID=362788 RepID=A0A835CJB4_9FABA|nr:uncharacterized protein G2W53_003500 [Senna tora]